MNKLDEQLSLFGIYLKEDVGITENVITKIGSTIAIEVGQLTQPQLNEVRSISQIALINRYDELVAFQRMMDYVAINKVSEPGLIRSQVITQNYICFVYLKDSYFRALQKVTAQDTVTHRCSKFLISERIRKFRNSIAHGNWNYKSDFSGLEYWDYLNGRKQNGYEKFELYQEELNFWQTLSRVVAYTSIEAIKSRFPHNSF